MQVLEKDTSIMDILIYANKKAINRAETDRLKNRDKLRLI
jgi:hypothetical protein